MKKQAFICLTLLLFTIIPVEMMGQKQRTSRKSSTKANTTTNKAKTDVDSISYAYGLVLAENLPMYLKQMGLMSDTMAVHNEFDNLIEEEGDSFKRNELERRMKTKITSVKDENNKNLNEFLEGFQVALEQNKGRKAYSAGIAIAGQMEMMLDQFSSTILSESEKLNESLFMNAFVASLKNEKLSMKFDNPQTFIDNKVNSARDKKSAVDYKANIDAETRFFAENKKNKDVVTLPSGLQYKVVTMGDGAKPTLSDMVKVHYAGKLIDGTQFDSSYERDEPASFRLTSVIKGWTEGLQLMPVGSKFIFYIPSNLAYGATEHAPIKPYSTLIFEVELLDIVKDGE